jgi:hypothetical protein
MVNVGIEEKKKKETIDKTHLLPQPKLLHLVALLDNLADKLMPADESRRSLQLAAIEVQIAAAQRGRRDFQHAVCVVLQARVRLVFDCHLVRALVDDCSHGGGGLEGGHGGCCCRVVLSLLRF